MSFTAFKRRLKVGTKVHTYHNGYDKDMGIRPVSIVQSKAVAFKTEAGTDSWIRFPPVSQMQVEGDVLRVFNPDGTPLLTYTIVNS